MVTKLFKFVVVLAFMAGATPSQAATLSPYATMDDLFRAQRQLDDQFFRQQMQDTMRQQQQYMEEMLRMQQQQQLMQNEQIINEQRRRQMNGFDDLYGPLPF